MNKYRFHYKWPLIIFILISSVFLVYLIANIKNKYPYVILSISVFIAIILLSIGLIIKGYKRSREKIITHTIRKSIYNLIFKEMTANSIFLIGIWKCSSAKHVGILPTAYIIFIYITLIMLTCFVNNEMNYLFKHAKNIKDTSSKIIKIPTHKIKDNKGNTYSIPSHKIKIIKRK